MADPILYTAEQEARARELVAALTKPTYVLRMAMAKRNGGRTPLGRSAEHSYAKAIRDIDNIIDELKVQPPI
jgi:hypothetical protein